ncbi:hypothetical protein ACHAQJ_003763 [Trichoderma viride]
MNVRDEIRKRFSRLMKSSPIHDSDAQATQEYQATRKSNTPPSDNNAIKNTESELSVELKLSNTPIHELWNLAYENLRQEDAKLIREYETKLQEYLTSGFSLILAQSMNARDRMEIILENKMKTLKRDAWKLQFGSSEAQVNDVLQIFSRIASKANDYISGALNVSPYASLAWAGISVLLPLFLNPSEQAESLAKGLEYISTIIVRGQMRESLYMRRYKSEIEDHQSPELDYIAYKAALETLYRKILKFQAKSYCHYTKTSAYRLGLDAVKWNDWEAMVDDMRLQEDTLVALDKLWHDMQYDKETLAAKKQHQESLTAWHAIGEDVSGLRKAIAEAAKDRDRIDFLAWLCQVDPSQMYNAARDRHEAGTSEWLMNDDNFRAWEKEERSLLWLHAGSGKSILSSSVINYINDQYKSDPLTAVAYFYFSFTDSQKQEVDVMLASIIKQISAHRPNIPQPVQQLNEYKVSGRRPDTQTLITALKATLLGFSAVYIIIDALDECPAINGERRKLLKVLSKMLNEATGSLHLLLTSRKESDINTAMIPHISRSFSYELDLLAYRRTLDDDIGLFIDSILASDDYESWPQEVKAEARSSLIEKADGMFQYIRCQFDALYNLSTVAEIRQALQNLPVGLGTTYDRMLLNISTNFQSRVINSLKWLAFSLSPIHVDWLAEIFTLRPECALPSDGTEKLFSINDILKYFSSLIIVSDLEVRLAHFSIKEYLTSTQIANGPALAFGFTEVDAHLHIAHSCLAYHLQHADNTQQLNYQQLGYYAGRQWARHLEMTSTTLWPSDIIQKATYALDARSKSLAKMISLMRAKVHHQNLFLMRPLCFTAWQNLSGLTTMLLSCGPGTNIYFTQEDLDVALQYAAFGGSLETVQRLLEEGAQINAEDDISEITLQATAYRNYKAAYYDGSQHDPNNNTQFNLAGISEYGSALQAAASAGRLEVVKLLLDNGADIDAQYGKHGSALHAAAAKDYIDVVKFLVGRGADIRARSSEAGSVLASAMGHYHDQRCFHFLLEKGALEKDSGETALSKAAAERCWDACHLLLNKGANVNALSERFGSPLQAACARSLTWDPERLAVIERLLDLGADINAQGGVYGNALQAACIRGEIDVVRLLLDKGANVNAQGGLYGNALQASFFLKRETSLSSSGQEIIKLLLSRGANVNAQGGEYGNALQAACALSSFLGSTATVPLLFAHAVDIHAKGGVYGTALQAASAAGHVMTAHQLLDQGADVNEQGGRYGTALQAAYTNKTSGEVESMVKLLLRHGADAHLKGGHFGSALNAAAANASLPSSAIQQLLDLGVDINDSDQGRHGTALQAALEGMPLNTDKIGRVKILERIEFLLKCGADVNIEAGPHGFALQSACTTESGYFPLEFIGVPMWESIGAIFLLDNCPDININAKGGKFDSALQAAASSGQTDSVKLLIKKGANVNAQGGKYRNALNAAIVRGFWDIVRVLLENGAEPDCYRSENPDEEWLNTIKIEYGRGAKERYEKIWEMRKPKSNTGN